MLPTLCRMVLYRDPEGRGPMPAVVNQVDDSGVYVCAFDPVFGPRNFHTKGEGEGHGEWCWPNVPTAGDAKAASGQGGRRKNTPPPAAGDAVTGSTGE